MIRDFKRFLLETNALALAVGVIIGAAVGKLVGSLVQDVMMPIIGLAVPGGGWRELKFVLSRNPDGTAANAVQYGAFLGSALDFAIVAFVVFMITKSLLKPAPATAAPATKSCPACLETIPAQATRCRACTSPV